MRSPVTILLFALLLIPACEKTEEPAQPKASDQAAKVKADSSSDRVKSDKPAPRDDKKESIKAHLTCPPGTKVRHSAYRDSGAKWCIRPDGSQHGMSVEMFTSPKTQWPFKSAGDWKDGKRSGKWTWWHENGKEKKQGEYKDGAKSGPWLEWHKNGKQALESFYQAGHLHGAWKTWAFKGGLTSEGTYQQGKIARTWTFWSEGGKELAKNELGEEGTGSWKKFSALGRLLEEGKYKAGKKDGKWKEYPGARDEYGEGNYKDGIRVGKWMGWGTMLDKKNKKKKTKVKEKFYKNGKLHGKSTKWRNGKLSSVYNYKDGQMHGMSTLYSSGKRHIQQNHVNGIKEGKHLSWDTINGGKSEEGWYKAGKACGKWKCYYLGKKTKCLGDRSNLPKCK
ncbi:MAG: hypothetical protein JRJ19_09270 [Deltaproteobacteria bacterium]|nr:hypothetical protein [Deltaproteobacteria bacterium]MBW1872243.1 hypothetical protein [Deltaproteobacteria bacterium]